MKKEKKIMFGMYTNRETLNKLKALKAKTHIPLTHLLEEAISDLLKKKKKI